MTYEQIVSALGYGLIGFLLTAPAQLVIVFAIIAALVMRGEYLAQWATLAIAALLYSVAVGIVLSALVAIFGVVLDLFAKTGTAPEGFDAADLRGAIKPA